MYKQITTRHIKLIGSIVVVILFALIPLFIHSPYYLDLPITVIVNAILAMTFIMMLRTGLISLGIVAFWGVGAYASAILVMKLGLSFWLSLPASALITGVIALGIGALLIGSGSGGLAFVMLSSVIGMLFTVVIGNIAYLGGYSGIPNIPPPNPIRIPFLPPIEFVSKVQYFYLALVLLVVVILISKAFYWAWTGRAWTAVGLSPRLAESIGINVFRYKLLAFVVASSIAGLMGSFYAHYQGFILPDSFGMWQNIYVQLYAILGGMGYAILGPLLGSAVMTFLPEFMRIANVIAPIITGAILILLILFLPQGLLGLLEWRTVAVERAVKIGKTIESLLPTGRGGGKA
jgi:branched-chain amino acid transport system permease protein